MRFHRVGVAVLAAMLVSVWVPSAHAALLISELYYDHPGSDADHEFLELFNAGPAPVDLTGWVVEWAGAAWGDASLALAGVVPVGRFFLIGGTLTATDFGVAPDHLAAFAFQNGGSASDGVRIRQGGYTDTLLYDQPNASGLAADAGWDGSFAPDVAGGHSLARRVPWIDTDAMSDWEDRAVPGPSNRAVAGPWEGTVPEPASAMTFGLGVGWWIIRRQRKRRRVGRSGDISVERSCWL